MISQIAVHSHFGGVVPELATQGHLAALPKNVDGWRKSDAWAKPDLIAVTHGPGLVGGLAMGLSAARALSLYYGCPLLGINHLRGHTFSPFIPLWQEGQALHSLFPHLGLLVSGGNTLLFSVDENFEIQLVAATVDDAAGEALDKAAKMLGMPYPGGVAIEKLAMGGNPHAYKFPRAFNDSIMKFSFSGLKTALLYQLKKMDPAEIDQHRSDLCASYLQAICDALAEKVYYAATQFKPRTIGLSGGVSQNEKLRGSFQTLCAKLNIPLLLAPKEYCGDNASMIAFAAAIDGKHGEPSPRCFLPQLKL
jgi:N6-L-threonylcarbamoyladenine synthase